MSKDATRNLNDIAQIRDLIFGQQMQNYDAQFEQVEKKIAQLRQELKNAFTELREALQSQQNENEQAHSEIRRQLERTELKFQKSLAKTEAQLQETIDQLDHDSAKRRQLSEYLIEMGERLREPEPASSNQTESIANE